MDGDQEPDLDLDRPPEGDAQMVALFRDGLRRAGPGTDLKGIERRARQRHRRAQVVASGAVTMAAALAAVLVIASPWPSRGGGEVAPSDPRPVVTASVPDPTSSPDDSTTDKSPEAEPLSSPDTLAPDVTRVSLLQAGDLSRTADRVGSALGGKRFEVTAGPTDVSGSKLVGGICIDNEIRSNFVPRHAWKATWSSKGANVPPDYVVSETVAQWPAYPADPSIALDDLREQAAVCATEGGPEGFGITTDRTGDLEMNVPYLVVTATEGTGSRYAQAFMAWGGDLIAVSVSTPASTTEDDAYTGAMAVLQQALARLTGDEGSTGAPAGLVVRPAGTATTSREQE
ncbi:hypothetical protein [Kineosporia mesophila]|nr:hypothetical protein [Kineosporia mesophila]MCD5355131.1 hypothetical protein [Kineosporia mesophila]